VARYRVASCGAVAGYKMGLGRWTPPLSAKNVDVRTFRLIGWRDRSPNFLRSGIGTGFVVPALTRDFSRISRDARRAWILRGDKNLIRAWIAMDRSPARKTRRIPMANPAPSIIRNR